jgi:hypothetical protein
MWGGLAAWNIHGSLTSLRKRSDCFVGIPADLVCDFSYAVIYKVYSRANLANSSLEWSSGMFFFREALIRHFERCFNPNSTSQDLNQE